MKPTVVLAGGSGFIGKYLTTFFQVKGYDLIILSRKPHTDTVGIRYIVWDGETPGKWMQALEHAEAVINLSGKSVNCRYNEANRKGILESRIKSTEVLGEAIARAAYPPKVWINAATATIYRHAEDRPMTESEGEIGTGFSVGVAYAWEQAFFSVAFPDVRQVLLRTAIVLGNEQGGALDSLRGIARAGLGGMQGSGNQKVSWLHVHDLARIMEWAIIHPEAQGIYNASAPQPVSNATFMAQLRQSMGVHFGLNLRSWMLKLGAFFLQTETELILKSRWVLPQRLLEEGFLFQFSDIKTALTDLQQGLVSPTKWKGTPDTYSKSVGNPRFSN